VFEEVNGYRSWNKI